MQEGDIDLYCYETLSKDSFEMSKQNFIDDQLEN